MGPPGDGMRWMPGGTFRMGDDNAYLEEAPAHTVALSGFWIDDYLVTNADFATFVTATGYRTVAERPLDPAADPGADPSRGLSWLGGQGAVHRGGMGICCPWRAGERHIL